MLGCGCQGRDTPQGESQGQTHQDRTIYFQDREQMGFESNVVTSKISLHHLLHFQAFIPSSSLA